MENEDRGTLKIGEVHPASYMAMKYIKTIPMNILYKYAESFASCGIEDNRLAEICSETLHRILNNKPVSDRYLLGLAWMLKNLEENYGR